MKKQIIRSFLFSVITIIAHSQLLANNSINDISPQKDTTTQPIYVLAEVQAKFNNGTLKDFQNYVYSNLQYDDSLVKIPKYKPARKDKGYETSVDTTKIISYIQFTVDNTGKIVNVRISRSCGVIKLDMEVIRIIKNSPQWIPAKQNGTNVAQLFTIPITFRKTK